MQIKKQLITLGLGALLAQGISPVSAWAQKANAQKSSSGINFSDMDRKIRPQDNFYLYTNGGWMRKNPLKPAYSRFGTFDILQDTTTAQIHNIVEELAAKPQTKGSNDYRVAVLYKQAMDIATRNALGAQPIQPELQAIQALKDKGDVLKYLAHQDQEYGQGGLFGSGVAADEKNSTMNIFLLNQTSLGLGTRDYYVEKNAETEKILAGYEAYLIRILKLAGFAEAEASRIAKTTIGLEKELAQFSYSNTELRDSQKNYNIVNIADFARENKGFDWQGYFSLRGLDITTANFTQLGFFKAFDKWYQGAALADLKDFFISRTVSGAATSLSDDFEQAQFDFFGKQLSGRKEMHPRWRRSVGVVQSVLGEALGEVYVKRHFSPEAKERMLTLVHNLQKALGQRVNALTWMSEETKKRAQEKLSSFVVKIGYPDKWMDYSSLDIDESKTYYQNLEATVRFMQADNLKDLGKPVDRTKWLMSPQEVNAYYMPTTNEICFPAGILQPPFFNMEADDAVNYGAIGVVIGHEMTHGFDDEGSNFDKDGNMNNWWTAEDRQKFEVTTQRLAKQFSSVTVAPGLKANGELTLGENIADQGGLTIAYLALQLAREGQQTAKIDGLTPAQRFYIAYARLWGQNITEAEIRRLTKLDPHSLGLLRVNQALKNIDPFYKAFNIRPTDKMYLAPKDRVVVW
ncbi:M13 family metallopeptidase [uncultured Porphyromonas sp.]|uniref:M13 family metallopeptidase n=1 Tax=uncultured Porphyromonas sp. TaxID=159274 RepID=UPI00260C4591|nr:M13 family metallopeptidase [uncultured Porphyromonas sp.]